MSPVSLLIRLKYTHFKACFENEKVILERLDDILSYIVDEISPPARP